MLKRILSLMLCIFTCAALLVPFGVSAETNSMDDSLIIHYDFEGDTTEEALQDKATAGTRNERLWTSGTNTKIENGIAHIHNDDDSFIRRRLFGETENATDRSGPCEDIVALVNATGYTLAVKANVITPNSGFSDVLDIGNLIRVYTDGNGDSISLWSRFTSDAYSSADHAKLITKIKKNTPFILIVSVDYDVNLKTIAARFYVSQDDGKTYTTNSIAFSNVGKYLENAKENWRGINLGIVPANTKRGNTAIIEYDDIRLYNRALSQEEGRSIYLYTAETPHLYGTQTAAVTEDGAGQKTYGVRFVSTIDKLDYTKVGYQVSYSTDGTTYSDVKTLEGTTVYSSVLETGDDGTNSVTAQELRGTYIFAYAITDIPTTVTNFEVTLFTVDEGGTTTYGTYVFNFSNGKYISGAPADPAPEA